MAQPYQLVCFWIITEKHLLMNKLLYIVDVGIQWLQRLGEGRLWSNSITGRTCEAGTWTHGKNRTATVTETLTSGKSQRHLFQWCHWSSIAIISDVTYHDLISVRHWLIISWSNNWWWCFVCALSRYVSFEFISVGGHLQKGFLGNHVLQ